MAEALKVKIITLNNIVPLENVTKMFIKAKDGGLQIMPGHASMIASTIPNITVLEQADGKRIELFTSKGVVNVEKNQVTFCCDAAESKDDIDLERAKKAKNRAEERIKNPSNYDVERAKLALARATLRIGLKESSK